MCREQQASSFRVCWLEEMSISYLKQPESLSIGYSRGRVREHGAVDLAIAEDAIYIVSERKEIVQATCSVLLSGGSWGRMPHDVLNWATVAASFQQ
jgi:hypothetical protein